MQSYFFTLLGHTTSVAKYKTLIKSTWHHKVNFVQLTITMAVMTDGAYMLVSAKELSIP